ncbi:hypothetical protein F4604DRAFT_1678288 [Suillus subluteus]|nr:hypothetical protein F4604DRAFT_1678288 [Suillus subluteus]
MYYRSLFPNLPEVAQSNVHNLVLNRPDQREWPDYTLFVNVATGQQRSFKQFVERVRDGATALGVDVAQGGLGLRPENGELVGILSDNCLDYIALMHSLLVITVPFVPFSSYSTPHEFKHADSLARVTRIFASPLLLPLALTTGLSADRIYLLEGEDTCYTNYDQLVSSARKSGIPRLPVRQADKNTLAYLVFSSGTSGPPKGVLEAAKILEPPVWDTPVGIPVHLNVLPVYHSFSLFLTSFFNFIQPSTIVILPKWNIDLFFDSVPKYRITTLTLVPSLVHQLVHHPRFKTTDMSSVRSIGSGAAHLPSQLADELHTRFPDMDSITEGYGLSEFNKPGSLGILLPGVEARIIRPDGSLANPNEAGELLVRGGATALGYRENDKATRETFIDGWLRGPYQGKPVIYPLLDTLKISGMQVSPIEIENTILAQPDKLITDVSVAGVSGGRAALGEKVVVARLDTWVQERLSRYKWLRGGIGRVEMIPKSPTGKVLRRILVEEYERDMKAEAKL